VLWTFIRLRAFSCWQPFDEKLGCSRPVRWVILRKMLYCKIGQHFRRGLFGEILLRHINYFGSFQCSVKRPDVNAEPELR